MSGERIGCMCSARRLEDHYYFCPLATLSDGEVEAIKARVKAAVEDGAARERSYVSAVLEQDPAALAANALAETEPYLASGIRTCRVCECRMADVCFGCNRESFEEGEAFTVEIGALVRAAIVWSYDTGDEAKGDLLMAIEKYETKHPDASDNALREFYGRIGHSRGLNPPQDSGLWRGAQTQPKTAVVIPAWPKELQGGFECTQLEAVVAQAEALASKVKTVAEQYGTTMHEGTWRVVEGADGEDDLYLFRKGGGYAWFSLDGEGDDADGALLLTDPTRTFLTADWAKLAKPLADFLRGKK